MSWTFTVAKTDADFVAVATPVSVSVSTGTVGPAGADGEQGPQGDPGDPGADGDSFVPDPTAEVDHRMLEVISGALVYTDPPAGGGSSDAVDVAVTPAGTIASTNVQAALEELDGDARMSNSRTPTAHATSHQDGGADELALDGSQITSGTVADARIASTIARDSEVAAGYQPLDADLTTVAALDSTTAGALVTDGAGWIRKTYAQMKTALSLVKADVGLGSVDNTSDAGKPVSTAQQTALDLKANLASPALTGNPTAPTPSAADNDTSIATTAFVQGEITAKAPLASPTFTGDPKAPTASPGDNDTSLATTAFVTAAVAAGGGGASVAAAYYAAASGAVTLTTTAQDLTGATVTITVASTSDVYLVFGTFDMNYTGVATAAAVGSLVVDGTTKTGSAVFLQSNAPTRGTVAQTWRVTGLTAGSRVFKLQGFKNINDATIIAQSGSTTISVLRVS